MATGRANKLTGQIGEFLVCAELGRRGLIATPFSGNVPAFDVLAADEEGRTLPIQVKASNSEQWRSSADLWLRLSVYKGRQRHSGLTKITHPRLIYVFVALKSQDQLADRFFVLDKTTLQEILSASYIDYMNQRDWIRTRNPKSFDCRLTVGQIKDYEGNWQLVERRLGGLPDPVE